MDRGKRLQPWQHRRWPEPWRAAWEQAIKTRAIGTLRAGTISPKPETISRLEMAFGHYQAYLAQHGLHDTGFSISADNLRAFGGYHLQTASVRGALTRVATVLAAVRLMCPDADTADAQAIVRHAVRRQHHRRHKTIVRLSLHQLRSASDAWALGKELIADADFDASPTATAARQYRVGALLMAMAKSSLRLCGWCALRINKELDLDSGDVVVPASATTNEHALMFRLSPDLLAILRRYAQHYRPLLLRQGVADEMYLWPSQSGGRASHTALLRSVSRAARRHRGYSKVVLARWHDATNTNLSRRSARPTKRFHKM